MADGMIFLIMAACLRVVHAGHHRFGDRFASQSALPISRSCPAPKPLQAHFSLEKAQSCQPQRAGL
jgi:hypothetical protein